ncbi:kinase-like domain-containing protein [Absidia repens]|uniref:Kinase-like domain-containing protein n=1 Tax=Absidia repens TaxID=90262 RepID=A0A1X2IH58_9FUNG|nr:kinase-like domain-containing protein [Absidia repens]
MVLAGRSLIPYKTTGSLAPTNQPHLPDHCIPSPVLTTYTIVKDYDPITGNKIINNKYMIIRELGHGVHGKVKLAQSLRTAEFVAIKVVDKRVRKRQLNHTLLRRAQQQQQHHHRDRHHHQHMTCIDKEHEQKIRREIAILKKSIHPHVVKLMEVMEDPDGDKIYMVLEYMDGGEILWRDGQDQPVLNVHQARCIFRDVVSGLDYLHYQGIIHRDIKPSNLLYSKDRVVKITDFGVSYFNKSLTGGNRSKSTEASQQVDHALAETEGTPAFFAPELCWADDPDRRDERYQITKAIDVWALGVTLYCFIFGRCPFIAATEYELFEVIPNQPLIFPDDNSNNILDGHLQDLLERLMDKNPLDRITLEEVKAHHWVIQDLDQPELWWNEVDVQQYRTAHVTDEDMTQVYTVDTITDRLRNSIDKLSSSFSHLTQNITRRRSKRHCQPTIIENQHICTASDPLYNPSPTINITSLLPLSPPPMVTTMLYISNDPPSAASPSPRDMVPAMVMHAIDSSGSNYTSNETNYSAELNTDAFDRRRQDQHRYHGGAGDGKEDGRQRHKYQRSSSSTSSMSGLVVSFGRHQQQPTPNS